MNAENESKRYPRVGLVFTNCKDVEMGKITFTGDVEGAGVYAEDCEDIRAEEISFNATPQPRARSRWRQRAANIADGVSSAAIAAALGIG